jgi:hypothetical protein
MATVSYRRATGDVLAALVAAVGAITLPNGQWGSALPILSKAFDRVEVFDSEQLVEAFRYLLVTEQKVCVIVPMDERFSVFVEKRKLIVNRELPIALLISDRVLGSRKTALLGDVNTPGALNLVELVLPAVTGMLLPNTVGPPALSGVILEPSSSSVMSVKDMESDLPSRVCVGLELHARGGYLQADMPLGPVF